jgi:hypothetical protein
MVLSVIDLMANDHLKSGRISTSVNIHYEFVQSSL